MKPNYTTIITSIAPGREAALKQYLRNHAEPRPGSATNLVGCQPLFRFDKIKSLHFCSFVVLDGDGEFAPCLVFEATFDGPTAEFLRELWRVAPEGMHAVYEHCSGYPECGLAVPELIQAYLIRHDVGVHTFFSGCPGRSVAQIQGESRIRGEIVTFLAGRQTADAAPDTLAALQQTLQRDVVRSRPENRWAEQPAVTPWEVANRPWVVRAAALVVIAAVLGIGILAVRIVSGMWPLALCGWIDAQFSQLWQVGVKLARSEYPGWELLAGLTRQLELPILYLCAALALFWILVRISELALRSLTENPRAQFFWRRFALHLAFIFKIAVPVFLIGLVALGLVANEAAPFPTTGSSQVRDLVVKLDQKLLPASPVAPDSRSAAVSAILIVGIVAFWLLLRHWATTLKLAVQFQELKPREENVRRFGLDALAFARVVALLLVVLVLARHIPNESATILADHARPWIYVYLVTAAYALAGVLAVYLVGSLFLLAVRALERYERGKFEAAETLVTTPVGGHTWGREEGGINRYQNHLASLTYVKPWRRWLLRATLFLINLLSRFWFNRGTLGGIPTILSARWVLIDGGRRLLFLDNYSGAWGSYLNEFIDMGAVKGLNAIWTNTFIKTGFSKKGHAWPQTSYYLWEGAQAERPFKAYVRHSQIETIVWYSAYPTLSITNVNTNTDLRQSLFGPLAPCDLDCVIQRL